MWNQNNLFILPFDHRGTFLKLFGLERELPEKQVEIASKAKMIIYEGFKRALELGVPKEQAAILVDEQYGDAVLRDARANGYTVCLTTEKSGQKEFAFEYGDAFGEHIEKYKPDYVKALVHYNPDGDQELNARQRAALAELSSYCDIHDYQLLVEPLVPATSEQLLSVGGDEGRYDREVRPQLMVKLVEELQTNGIKPNVWKIEGLEKSEQYETIIAAARATGKENVRAIVLGRAASREQVETWLKAGARVDGVAGFAIGRTIFWDPLIALREGTIARDAAAQHIAENYLHFYKVFTGVRQ